MAQYKNDVSNMSYTNKDFGQIYPELLETAKKLSYKWDPTISDESDPGVVLLKLAAIVADKNNYNIDKNILELFPASVTQLQNAHQIFEQCGYYMRYYRSAETTVSMNIYSEPKFSDSDIATLTNNELNTDLDKPENARVYTIPAYTMLSDIDNSIIYTTTESVSLTSQGEIKDVPVIQGTINDYTINGEFVITRANLDSNNRIYFNELDIPENGIFIHNIKYDSDSTTYKTLSQIQWKRVDNIYLEPLGTYCYKFGLTDNGSSCYIEFPSDIESLIGNGIVIKYLRTKGFEGNISRKFLKQFFTDISVECLIQTQGYPITTVLTTENVNIFNNFAATNGYNPESIDDAYRNYQKIKTTFDTLVSTKDYSNFLYSNKNVSNSFVCDRTNDVQSSYSVVEYDDQDRSKIHTYVKSQLSADKKKIKYVDSGNTIEIMANIEEPELSEFDLRIYALHYKDNPVNISSFNQTFDIIDYQDDLHTAWFDIIHDTQDIKSIPHKYRDFKLDEILMIKNKYPIIAKIIPTSKLTFIQQVEVLSSIKSRLCSILNARKIEFGEPVDYQLIYDTILNADSRIRAITLEDIDYETYAVYCTEKNGHREIKEIRIDDQVSEYILTTDEIPSSTTEYYTKDIKTGEYVLIDPLPTGFQSYIPYYVRNPEIDIELRTKFRSEIYARSVLAGRTPLFPAADNFTYSLNQSNGHVCENVYSVTTNTTITANYQGSGLYETNALETNENIVFIAPNYLTSSSAGVNLNYKFLHNINIETTIPKNFNYALKEGEYFITFWKDPNSSDDFFHWKMFDATTQYNVICPNFPLEQQVDEDGEFSLDAYKVNSKTLYEQLNVLSNISNSGNKKGTTQSRYIVDSSVRNISLTDFIDNLNGKKYVNSTGEHSTEVKKLNKIQIPQKTNVFWITNYTIESDQKTKQSKLFKENENKYILKSGEYFFYTNETYTQLHMLGAGTILERSDDIEWICDHLNEDDISELLTTGPDFLTENSKWKIVPEGITLTATETKYHQFGPNYRIKFTPLPGYTNLPNNLPFSADPCDIQGYQISAVDLSNNETQLEFRNNAENLNDLWQCYTMLNLNMSNKDPQILLPHQEIILHKLNENGSEETVRIKDNENPINILSSTNITIAGGKDIPVYEVDALTELKQLPKFYTYTDSQHGERIFADGNNVKITYDLIPENENNVDYQEAAKEINFTLPPGQYILPVRLSSSYYDKAEIGFVLKDKSKNKHDQDLKYIHSSDDMWNDYKGKTVYYRLYIDKSSLIWNENTGKKETTVRCQLILAKAKGYHQLNPIRIYSDDKSTGTIDMIIGSPLRYNSALDSTTLSRYQKIVDSLDVDKVFNYNYQIPQDKRIENPLDPKSFMDTLHPYNAYTICQWNVSEESEKNNKIIILNDVL